MTHRDLVEDWLRATDEWNAVTATYEAALRSSLEYDLTDEERALRELAAERLLVRAGEIKGELAALVRAGRAGRSGTGDEFVAGVVGSISTDFGGPHAVSDAGTTAVKIAK